MSLSTRDQFMEYIECDEQNPSDFESLRRLMNQVKNKVNRIHEDNVEGLEFYKARISEILDQIDEDCQHAYDRIWNTEGLLEFGYYIGGSEDPDHDGEIDD